MADALATLACVERKTGMPISRAFSITEKSQAITADTPALFAALICAAISLDSRSKYMVLSVR